MARPHGPSARLADKFRREVTAARSEETKADLEERMIRFSKVIHRTKDKICTHRATLLPMESVMKAPTAEKLADKGLTVRQLLYFYDHYLMQGRIKRDTKTEDIVRDIILPETCDEPRCYMESSFMQQYGGPQRATKLVSHAWMSQFSNTVLNIVLDALEWSRVELLESLDRGLLDTPYFDRRRGVLSALKLMKDMSSHDLDKKYWLCIFAVNQHRGMCGECQHCKDKEAWKADVAEHLRADPCMICGKKKYIPCQCATTKHYKYDPWYELDLFPLLLKRMEGLVVALDPLMRVLKRAWVVSEIGEALVSSSVTFRCAQGLSRTALKKLNNRFDFLDSIVHCDASLRDDRIRILRDVRRRHGDIQAFDRFWNIFFELQFGRLLRLPHLSDIGMCAVERLTKLEMNYSWNQYLTSDSLTIEVGDASENFAKFKQLKHLSVNFERCGYLQSLGESFMLGIPRLELLRTLAMSFRDCRSLDCIDALGVGLSNLQAKFLTRVKLDFTNCAQLASVESLGRGLGYFTSIESLSLNFKDCVTLESVEQVGLALANLRRLTYLSVNCRACKCLTSVDTIGKALSQLTALHTLELNLYECDRLQSLDEFGLGLAGLHGLRKLELILGSPGEVPIRELGRTRHQGVVCINELGGSIAKLQSLAYLTLDLQQLRITSIDELSKALTKLARLNSLRLCLDGCNHITSFVELRKSLLGLHTLSDFLLDLQHCNQLHGNLRKQFDSQEVLHDAISALTRNASTS